MRPPIPFCQNFLSLSLFLFVSRLAWIEEVDGHTVFYFACRRAVKAVAHGNRDVGEHGRHSCALIDDAMLQISITVNHTIRLFIVIVRLSNCWFSSVGKSSVGGIHNAELCPSAASDPTVFVQHWTMRFTVIVVGRVDDAVESQTDCLYDAVI